MLRGEDRAEYKEYKPKVNLNERIRQQFGSDYGVWIDHMAEGGTQVVPLKPKEDKMLKVLIADERIVRKTLRLIGNWDKYEMELVGEAQNGIEVLEMIDSLPLISCCWT